MKKRVRVREPIAMSLGLWWDGRKRINTSERHHLGTFNINRPLHIIGPLMIKVNSPTQRSILASLSNSAMFPWPRALCHRTTKPSFSFQPIHCSQLFKVWQIPLLKRNRTISSEASIKFPKRGPFDRSFIHTAHAQMRQLFVSMSRASPAPPKKCIHFAISDKPKKFPPCFHSRSAIFMVLVDHDTYIYADYGFLTSVAVLLVTNFKKKWHSSIYQRLFQEVKRWTHWYGYRQPWPFWRIKLSQSPSIIHLSNHWSNGGGKSDGNEALASVASAVGVGGVQHHHASLEIVDEGNESDDYDFTQSAEIERHLEKYIFIGHTDGLV